MKKVNIFNAKILGATERAKRLKAFTLAEVLITLAIIGVVASMTIPALMNKTQDTELKNAWKNDYAIINQAFQRAKIDNGGDMGTYISSADTLAPALKPYLINIKACGLEFDGINYSTSKCMSSTITELNGKVVGGTGFIKDIFDDGGFILQNGATLAFENSGAPEYYNGIYYAYIWIDVNGWKAPNTIGKDIFGIVALKDRLIPMGITVPGITDNGGTLRGLPQETACDTSHTGIACSALYLHQ